MARTVVKCALAALAVLSAWPADAQEAPVPNVNDCTFIRDPIALRDCIDLYQGQRLAPGPRTAAFQPRRIVDQSLLDAAGPIPGRFPSARRKRAWGDLRPASYRPSSNVRIEQVRPRQ